MGLDIGWFPTVQSERSLRYSIALGFSVFVIFFTGILFLAVWEVAEQHEEDLIDQIVSEEMDYLIKRYNKNPTVIPHQTNIRKGYIARTVEGRQALPELIRDLAVGFHEVFSPGGELHAEVRDLDETRFYITYDVTFHEERVAHFERVVLLGFVIAAIISIWLGIYLSGLLLKPVSKLAEIIDSFRLEHEQILLAPLFHVREVKRLARAFDRYIHRIRDLLEREQSFTIDVSHELRTPLTSITTSCELLEQEKNISDKSRKRIARIHNACKRMTELVEGLLFLAREGDMISKERVVLLSLVKSLLEPFTEIIADKDLNIQIQIDKDEVIDIDPHALSIVISNIIKNAIDHTEHGDITIQYKPQELTITDSGEGMSEEDLRFAFNRLYRGKNKNQKSTGFGLGLSIVKKITNIYDWKIKIESSLEKGTRIHLNFSDNANNSSRLTE